ncbi:aspartate dehydrogenase [Candidatus Desantisbacteria bacterium CG1_02_38_46]|uniref:L-aspartate dehydrogenase n=2 Tax=unclassified Candidatus Desantisiibacteriota TaxID=3106372 RepID=A0A2H9PA25_9BACT|nr:MAG: aspartate dehydrogenase [Candidatus Desantisbacteria bacterium CG1_02_38_46]PIZ15226.1 MAG: aspartate dehydrogenase [Candidatus Desantisbacteria bacterium CG_4_10_14_0_8_um_filter_39_17]
MEKIKVGVIGCGTIGSQLCKFIDAQLPHMALVAICDILPKKTKQLADNLINRPRILEMERLIDESDLVVESASKDVCKEIVRKCCEKGKDTMVMSTGCILENQSLLDLVRRRGVHLYLPSGAIVGLDGIKAAAIGEIESITLTTRKPPKGFEGAPFIDKNHIKLNEIKEETLLFEGTALEAVAGFPANINVAATLSLAGVGAKKTNVRILTSPQLSTNVHEIEVKGEHGRFTTSAENLPSLENPKTSYLAVLSAMATLKQIADTVKIGT